MISKEDTKIVERYSKDFFKQIKAYENIENTKGNGTIQTKAVEYLYTENIRNMIQSLFSKVEIEYLSKLPSFIEDISEEKATRWKELALGESQFDVSKISTGTNGVWKEKDSE